MSEHSSEKCCHRRIMHINSKLGWLCLVCKGFSIDKETWEIPADEIAKLKAENERLTKENRSMMIEQQSQFDLDGAEITKLREDKARLIGALKETTKFLGTSASLIIGTLKYTNEQLLTEMEGK